MKFVRLEVSNFLSFAKRQRLTLADAGLVLVEGENRDDSTARSNAAGKSSIVEALLWCLYGVTIRGYAADQVVNRRIGKDCLVVTTLEIAGSTYEIQRARRHHEHRNKLTVRRDGEDISKGTTAEMQALIVELLGMHLPTFLSSVVYGQGHAYRFSRLTDREQKEILDDALGTARFARAGEAAREETRRLLAVVADLTKDREVCATRQADLERQRHALAQERREAKTARLERQAELQAEFRAAATERQALARKAAKLVVPTVPAKLRKLYIRLDTEVASAGDRRAELSAELKLVHAEIASHKDSGSCPTCGRAIDAEAARAHKLELRKRQRTLSDACVSAARRYARATEARDTAYAAITLIETEARVVADERHAITVEMSAKSREIERIRGEIERLEQAPKPFDKLIASVDKAIDKLTEERARLSKMLARRERKLEAVRFWIDGFGAKGVRSLLIDTALPLLNQTVAEYSEAISGGAMHIEFSTTTTLKSGKATEKFFVHAETVNGAQDYEGHSTGEKSKIDLCVGLALQTLVQQRRHVRTNVVFLDECTEGMDETAADGVAGFISKTFRDQESVFVITHSEALKAFFPHVITIVKRNGRSRITQGDAS